MPSHSAGVTSSRYQIRSERANDRIIMRIGSARSSADPDDSCAQINQIGCVLADDRRSAARRPGKAATCALDADQRRRQ